MNFVNICVRSIQRVSFLKNNILIMVNRHSHYTCTTIPITCRHVDLNTFKRDSFRITNLNSGRYASHLSAEHPNLSWSKRILRKLGRLDHSDAVLRKCGFSLYEKCTDGVNLEEFRKFTGLPDTYFSWFLVTELHVWLCLVRVMHEGEEGRRVRNAIVETLWRDADAKSKKLGGSLSSGRRKEQLNEFYEQFIAALFLYDEGLQSSDKVLAGALWRRILQSNCEDPEILEKLLQYVRQQILHLESASREDVLVHGNVSWLPISELPQG